MQIAQLFVKSISRPINGVVKADELDESSIWQELDEFVVTRELDGHFRRFFSTYCEAIDHPNDPNIAGRTGIWISGFFGCGKSHFLKVLSYLLKNDDHTHDGQSKRAVEFFESKIKDAMVFGDIQRAVASNTDVILFNIDSKAVQDASGKKTILPVFLKVLNEMQGYSPDHPHIAHMERYLDSKGKLETFRNAFQKAGGMDWKAERDAYQFHHDEVIQAWCEATGQSKEAAEKWIDGAEESFALSVENFCKWVKEYLDSKGPQHQIIFLVDEVGQFIGSDTHLMLNLQTITEGLGTVCRGRAWIVVTSQENMDAVLGEMKTSKVNDFSKIQGRFKTRLSLSSANVDEVIQERLLKKKPEVVDDLKKIYDEKGDILQHQLGFTNGVTFPKFKDSEDFAKSYPFAPYQFRLVQRIFEEIRQKGATGLHLSRGERSVLDAFQDAGKQVADQEVGVLVPLYRFYPAIQEFLDTAVKKTIDHAGNNESLKSFDITLLKVLFLIRYVDEMKGNIDNLVTLCLDKIDGDRLALKKQIEESLARLENQTLISRSGENFFFLTNEERDINQEIKRVDLVGGEEARLLGKLIFEDVLKDQRKHRYSGNKMIFMFNRVCDGYPIGTRTDGALLVSCVTPLADDFALYQDGRCVLDSSQDGGQVLVRLSGSDTVEREIRAYAKTEKYLRAKVSDTLPPSTRRVHNDLAEENRIRWDNMRTLLSEMLTEAGYFVAGTRLETKATAPGACLDEAMEYLVKNTFSKMDYLKILHDKPEDTLKEIQAILRANDIGQQTLALQVEEGNPQAIDDVKSYVDLCGKTSRPVVLHEMIQKRYAMRPYGWPEMETALIVARLMVLGEIGLMTDGALLPAEKAYEPLTSPAKWRKITVVRRRVPPGPVIQKARSLGKELFSEMGPDGADALFTFLTAKLRDWRDNLNSYKTLADTGRYPGQQEIDDGLTLIKSLLACTDSFQFIERFNERKDELQDFAEQYRDVHQFYEHQRPVWEKLHRSSEKYMLNRHELEAHDQAGPGLRRMQEILGAKNPYGLIKEVDGLITTVDTVNSQLLSERRAKAIEKIDGHVATLKSDIGTASGDGSLHSQCLGPLEKLGSRVEGQDSLAHIAQAEEEAVRLYDAAVAKIEDYVAKKAAEAAKSAPTTTTPTPPTPVVRKQRVIRPAELVSVSYLETDKDVDKFLEALGKQLREAVANGERIQIR